MLWIAAIISALTSTAPTQAVPRAAGMGPDSQMPVARDERVREWAAADPEAFWPYWVQGKGVAWTATGLPGAAEVGLFGHDAAAGSTAWPFTLSAWVRDEATGEWIAAERTEPADVAIGLRSGFLPVPRARIRGRPLALQLEYLVSGAGSSFPDGVAVFRARVANASGEPRDATLVLAVRPYLVDGRLGSVRALRWDRDAVWVNDSIPVAPDRVPAARVLADLECDGRELSRRVIEADAGPACDSGVGDLRAGAFVFPLTVAARSSEGVALLAPLAPVRPGPTVVPEVRRLGPEELAARAAAHWRSRFLDLPFELPDSTVMGALRASLGYILIAIDAGLPQPGPHSLPGFRPREGAYITAALLRSGLAYVVAPGLEALMKAQLPDGRFPSAEPDAWDAQGQAIFALADYVRFTGDTTLARKHRRAVRRGAEFLRRLRAPMAGGSMHGTVVFGLLPASIAPDHLNGEEGHHYWDDFWAIRGLRDAAELAALADDPRDTAWMVDEAEALRRAIRVSYRQTMLVARTDWIPDSPEDLYGSSMARGTCAGLWPGSGLDPQDSVVRRSFDHYWETWVAPYDGAYLHRGRLWPYAFELALCELVLDRPERAHAVLRWHLAHPTLAETFAWAEQLDTATYARAGGDMPHAWVAADYVNLVRSMLLYERGDTLVLGAGILPEWLRAGTVAARRAPSRFGEVSFRVSAEPEAGHLVWEIEAPARAGGLVLMAPVGAAMAEVEVDDRWVRRLEGARSVALPADLRRVEVRLAPP